MIIIKRYLLFSLLLGFCLKTNSQSGTPNSIASVFNNTENIAGKPQNLNTPYNTSGDKLYMIGNQDGTFPDLGWHVKGEMGGIWHHPIKLADGFEVNIKVDDKNYVLDKADAFINFPFGNKHVYNSFSDKISVERFQFVPDEIGAVYIEFAIKNKTGKAIKIDFDIQAISNLMPVWLSERTGMMDGKDLAEFDERDNYWIVKDINENQILKLTFEFALDIIEFIEILEIKKKFIISNQLLKSGTSIGSNSREAQNAESKADFIHKFKIAAKEADETEYWLLLCFHSKNYPDPSYLLPKLDSIIALLNSIIGTTKARYKVK